MEVEIQGLLLSSLSCWELVAGETNKYPDSQNLIMGPGFYDAIHNQQERSVNCLFPHWCKKFFLKCIRWDKDGYLWDVLSLESAIKVLWHVHLHFHGLRTLKALNQNEFSSLPVWTLHHKMTSAVSSHNPKTQAVRAGSSRSWSSCHAEESSGSDEIRWQREVMEWDGLWSVVAQSAVHGTWIPFALAGKEREKTQEDLHLGKELQDMKRSKEG